MSHDKLVGGRYRYIRSIGRGGFSDVCLAEDIRLGGRYVAIKRIAYHLLHDPERLEKFQQEAEIIGRLTSPFTVRAYDYGKDEEGRYFIVMEYVEGPTLHKALAQDGPFTIERSLQIGIQLLDALEEAHDQGIIHRDLKPKNIILAPSRQGDLVKVLDFGVARILDPEGESDDWTLVGTASYMAPEQAQGKPVSPASDLYSVGVLLYHALTGKPPFVSQEDPVAVMIHHATKPVLPMREARPDLNIPEALDQIILRALEKQPSRRYTHAGGFRDALEEILVGEQVQDTLSKASTDDDQRRDPTDPYGIDKDNPFVPSSSSHIPASPGKPLTGQVLTWKPVHQQANTTPDSIPAVPDEGQDGFYLTGIDPEAPSAASYDAAPRHDAHTPRSGTLHAHLPPPPMVKPAPPRTHTLPLGEPVSAFAMPPRLEPPPYEYSSSEHETHSFRGKSSQDLYSFSPSSHEDIDADTQLTSAANNPAALLSHTPSALSSDDLITANSLSSDQIEVSNSSILSRGMVDLDMALEADRDALPHLSEDDISTAPSSRKKQSEDNMLLDDLMVFQSEHKILDALMGDAPELPELPELPEMPGHPELPEMSEVPLEDQPSTLDLKPNKRPNNEPTHPPHRLSPPATAKDIAPPIDVLAMAESEEPTDNGWDAHEETAQTTVHWGDDIDEDSTMSLGPLTPLEAPPEDNEIPTDPESHPGSTMLEIARAGVDEHTLEPTESGHASPFYRPPQLTPAPQPAPGNFAQGYQEPFGLGPSKGTSPHTMMRPMHMQTTPDLQVPQASLQEPKASSAQEPLVSWDLPPAFLEPDDETNGKSPQELGIDWQDHIEAADELDASFQPNQRLRQWGVLGGFAFVLGLIVLLASAGEGKQEIEKRHREQRYKENLQEGDQAIRSGLYHKAYASYRQALSLRPNDRVAAHRLHVTQLDLEADSFIKRAKTLQRKGQLLQAYRLLQKIDPKASLWEERGKKELIELHHVILQRLGQQINFYRRKRRWEMAHIRCQILPQFIKKHPLLQTACPFIRKKFLQQQRRRR